jgi:quercetin dioxygenase-like cupin family protein
VRVVTSGDRGFNYGGFFTGQVELEMLNETPSDSDPDTALVRFSNGALTNWHHHPGGQLLYVVSGRGRVGTREEPFVSLEPGNLVVAVPDESHWHGAASGVNCTMLAITWGTTCWHDEAPDLGG